MVGVLDYKIEVFEVRVTLSCGNGYDFFVNRVLQFGKRAIGRFGGGGVAILGM